LLDGYEHSFLDDAAVDLEKQLAEFDVVLVNGWQEPQLRQSIRACWRRGVPVMVRGDSHLREPRPWWKRVGKELPYRWALGRMSACLAVGSWSRDYFLHYGVPAERVFIVPHMVAESWFAARAPELERRRGDLRRQWSLAEQGTVLLFAGKFIPKKRPMDLLRAVQQAAASTRFEVLIAGDGPLRSECERFVAEHRLPVCFAGFLNQSQIASAYVASDLLVLPSDGGETWGLVVNEAMSCSRPALVSDRVGCGPDLVLPGRTGEIFPLGDVSALGSLIQRYAGDSATLERMGREAKNRVAEFSQAQAIEGVVQAVFSVAQDTRR
jgi:glycosyltransferase involved in cell wall biosynthesis